MATSSNPIMVLRQMVAAYDENPPKTEKQIDAFIARWQKKERADTTRKRSEMAVDIAVNSINRREIETIAETKKFRDEQRERRKEDMVGGGHKSVAVRKGKKRKKLPPMKPVEGKLKRNVIW